MDEVPADLRTNTLVDTHFSSGSMTSTTFYELQDQMKAAAEAEGERGDVGGRARSGRFKEGGEGHGITVCRCGLREVDNNLRRDFSGGKEEVSENPGGGVRRNTHHCAAQPRVVPVHGDKRGEVGKVCLFSVQSGGEHADSRGSVFEKGRVCVCARGSIAGEQEGVFNHARG